MTAPACILRKLFAIASACTLLAAVPVKSLAQADNEYAVKSAFILNFLKFAEFPLKKAEVFNFCIFQDLSVASTAEILSGKRVGSKSITVTLIKSEGKLTECDGIFIPRASDPTNRIIPVLKSSGILTIGEGEDFIYSGGMLAFVSEEDKIRFVVSKNNAEAEGIHFSAKLLALALKVQ